MLDQRSGAGQIVDSSDRCEAKRRTDIVVAKHRKAAPHPADWIDANVAEALAVLALPPEHRRRLRANNAIEQHNKEIRRRITRRHAVPNR